MMKRPESAMSGGAPAPQRKSRARVQPPPRFDDDDGTDVGAPKVFDSVSLDEIDQEMGPKYDPCCFGCQWRFGKPSEPDREPEMNELFECYVYNRGKLSTRQLCETLSELQIKLFVTPYLSTESVPPKWTPRQVEVHLQRHSIIYETELDIDYEKFSTVSQFLLNNIGKKDPITKQVTENTETIKLWLSVVKEKQNTLLKIQQSKRT
jgi:hypothetical protein